MGISRTAGVNTKMDVGKLNVTSLMDIYDVNEMFSRYYVDPDIAQRNIPTKWKVKIHDNGKAVLLLMVQNCNKMVLDYLSIGHVVMSHIWIEIEGPYELLPPLPGTTKTLPTWYWYILPHQVDKALARAFFELAGVSSRLVCVFRTKVGQHSGTTGPLCSGMMVNFHRNSQIQMSKLLLSSSTTK